MIKLFSNFIRVVTTAACCVLLAACGSSDEGLRYLAVQLEGSEMWSIVDTKTGEVILEDEFKNAPSEIRADRFFVKNSDDKFEYYSIDNVTNPINSEPYYSATAFSPSGFALVSEPGKVISLIDTDCKVIKELPAYIREAYNFSYGLARVINTDGKVGYINEKGELAVKCEYDGGYRCSPDGYMVVYKHKSDTDETKKFYLIDRDGKELFSFSEEKYKDCGWFVNGYLPVLNANGDLVLLDKSGEKKHTIGKYDSDWLPATLGVYNNAIIVRSGEFYGLKNLEGKYIIRAKYQSLDCIHNGEQYIAVKNDKWGIVDIEDNIVVPFDYEGLVDLGESFVAKEGSCFDLYNFDNKKIGKESFSNIAGDNGIAISNYYDAEGEAAKIAQNITKDSFYGTKPGQTLRAYSDYLTMGVYSAMSTNTLTVPRDGLELTLFFSNYLASQRYEYFWGYSYPTTPAFNYSASLGAAGILSVADCSNYLPGAEESLDKAITSKLKAMGYKDMANNDGWLVNPAGNMYIGTIYEDGKVNIVCFFDKSSLQPLIKKGRKKATAQTGSSSHDELAEECDSCDSCLTDTVVVDYPQ